MNEIPKALVLHQQLEEAGIPIDGVSGPPWEALYAPGATDEDRKAGDSICAAFDGKPLVARPAEEVAADLEKLSADDVARLLLLVAARALADDPSLARRAGIEVESHEKR